MTMPDAGKDATKILGRIAQSNGRDYVTPEDITEAFSEGYDESRVRLEVLALIGGETGFGMEDSALCAFVAWQGAR